ncbi:MAG TPA: DUF1707 domain-containing protein [Spirochaetia bacterium]|nr:DUF1707 domain-containing protein [Spirochaetia bacterium]
MSDSPDGSLPAHRATDTDREATARRLRDAVADGRLDLNELEERMGVAYSAKTQAELDALIADLPAAQAAEVPTLDLQTTSGSLKKSGYWRVPSHVTAQCTSGRIVLDFTEADCPHREVTLEVTARSGSVILIVPHGWAVDLDRASAKSGTVVNKARERPAPDAPLLRVSGSVQSGRISARYPRRSFRAWLSGRRD